MKSLVIESTPTVIRWVVESGSPDDGKIHDNYQLIGRRINNGPWLWTDGEEQLSAFEDEVTDIKTIWKNLLSSGLVEAHHSAEILSEALAKNIKQDFHIHRLVFLVPDGIAEISQNLLLTSLSNHFKLSKDNIYLLWRSVALALSEDPGPRSKTRRLVADFGHFVAEACVLDNMVTENLHCPIRHFRRERGSGRDHNEAIEAWLKANYRGKNSISDFLNSKNECALYKKLNQDLNFDPPEIWTEDELFYSPLELAHDDYARPSSLDETLKKLLPYIDGNDITEEEKILWHGWPVYWHGELKLKKLFSPSVLLEPDSVVRGGIIFANRLRLGLPTYFEELPGFDIWCLVEELGLPKKWQWEPLINNRRISGTRTLKAVPNERFQLNAGTSLFSLNIRLGGDNRYRFVEKELPDTMQRNTPIEIHSEIRPTGGSVKISLRAKNNPELFGQTSELTLRWDNAEERDVADLDFGKMQEQKFAYPFIIQNEGSRIKRDSLKHIAKEVVGGRNVDAYLPVFDSLIVQSVDNQFVIPFGNRKIYEGLSDDMEILIYAINRNAEFHVKTLNGPDSNSWKWVRIGGSLFYYASEEFQETLFKQILLSDFPISDYKISALFWGFGRVCRKHEQFQKYLEKALSEWDNLDGMHYWLFWPFAKSLCCYPESARISRSVAYNVFEKASQMLDWLISNSVPSPRGIKVFGKVNWLKWTLSALLFGLRIRELNPDFMRCTKPAKKSSLPDREVRLANRIKKQLAHPKIIETRIPPFALAGLEMGDNPPSLSELVIRFLEAEADESDLKLAGGIGRVS